MSVSAGEMAPSAVLKPLEGADGSASYSINGYAVLAAVNGPVEVQRRDELPEEAAIEVVIRPAAGVGGVRERHLESIVHKTLRRVVRVTAHPRTLIQVVLQVTAAPGNGSATGRLPQAASNLAILPPLLNAALLALLTTSIPLEMTFTSTIVAISADRSFVENPSPLQLQRSSSVHVVAFSSGGKLLVAESEGVFDVELWEGAMQRGKMVCLGDREGRRKEDDMEVGSSTARSLQSFVRDTVATKLAAQYRWREVVN